MKNRQWEALLTVTGHNIKRWKWRLFSIAILIAVAFVLHVSYAGSIEATMETTMTQSGVPRLAYDFMIQLGPGERVLSEAEWPASGYQFRIHDYYTSAVEVSVTCVASTFDVLGLKENSGFYTAEQMTLEGRLCAAAGEIVLPREIAMDIGADIGMKITLLAWQQQTGRSQMRRGEFTVVGIYEDLDLTPALVRLEDAEHLYGSKEPNRFLINYLRSVAQNRTRLYQQMRKAYPVARIIHAGTLQEVSRNVQDQIQQPGQGLLLLISLFVCIGVLTIAVMTFLERRKELAAFKTVGVSNRQIALMLILEYGLAEIGGLLLGGLVLLMMAVQIEWMRSLPAATLLRLILVSMLNTLVAVVVALIYPIWTACVASVNQLLYARRIALGSKRIDHIENVSGDLIYKERKENVRLVRFIPREEAKDILVLKQVGDITKEGEVVASQEMMFGFYLKEWLAPCDGEVVEVSAGGLIAVRPFDPHEKFYPYPTHLLEMEQRREAIRLRTAKETQEEMADLEAAESSFARALSSERRFSRSRQRQEQQGRASAATTVSDYATQARAEQRQSERSAAHHPALRWIRPMFGLSACVLLYWSLSMQFEARHQRMSYDITVASVTTIQDAVEVSGTLFAPESEAVTVRQSGRVEEVMVRSGTYVAKGQPLVVLSNPLLLSAMDQAQITRDQAQLQYDALRLQSEAGISDYEEQRLHLVQLQNAAEKIAIEQGQLTLTAPNDGRVVELRVQEGETISAGQGMLDFFDMVLESPIEQQTRLLQAHAVMESAERARQQLDVRATSDGSVETVHVHSGQYVAMNELLITVRRNETALTPAEALAWQQALLQEAQKRQALEGLTLRAPCDGLLSGLKIERGATVKKGDLLGHLSDTSELLITVMVPQSQIGRIKRGDTAEVTLTHNGFTVPGIVAEITDQGQINAASQAVGFAVDLRVNGRAGAASGMAATVLLYPQNSSGTAIGPLRGVFRNTAEIDLFASEAGEIREVWVQNGEYITKDQDIAVIGNENLELNLALAEGQTRRLVHEDARSSVEARVSDILVSPGEAVHQGQLLLRLENQGVQAAWQQAKQDYEALLAGQKPNRTLWATTAGTLAAWHVQEGDEVRQGQVLAELDNTDLEYRLAQAEVAALKQEAVLQARMLNPGSGAFELARLNLAYAEQALEQSKRNVENLVLRAPCAGVVRLVNELHKGSSLPYGQVLAFVTGSGQCITVGISEEEISLLRPGMDARLEVDAFPDELFVATLADIDEAGSIAETGTSYPVTFDIAPDERLKAGMSATVSVVLREAREVLAVPNRSVRQRTENGEGYLELFYFNSNNSGRVVGTSVITGFETKDMIEITRGVQEGDIVVVDSRAEPYVVDDIVDEWLGFIRDIGKSWLK